MLFRRCLVLPVIAVLLQILLSSGLLAQQKGKSKSKQEPPKPPSATILSEVEKELDTLRMQLSSLRSNPPAIHDTDLLVADVAVFEKAATWMLRFKEFPKADSVDQLRRVIASGIVRAQQLADGNPAWLPKSGMTVCGYVSRVDGSVQPFAVTLPEGVNPAENRRWPLHVVLHGRADQMNEVNFIARMDGKPLKQQEGQPPQTWIQLDVYGRGNNAYRWAGETDVFEAMSDLKRRFRIDEDRVTLHGFSMGGAGAWHLGMHHPAEWSSVGAGAGFVDFYRYQKKDPENPEQRLPEYQHQTLSIYDSVNYAMNAFNVPVCTYGGENDPQLLASTSMRDAAEVVDVPLKMIVGPKMGHAFDPDSLRQFMAFHQEQSRNGRPKYGQRKHIRFTTYTLRFNKCDWITIEEMTRGYEPATVEAMVNDEGDVEITTSNVDALRVMRDAGANVILDGVILECRTAADGLLPDVFYVRTPEGWEILDYEESRGFSDNPEQRKRHRLQGPIDDAFMDSFVCVRGTGQPWNTATGRWSEWNLTRLQQEFAQWMRGDVRVIDDSQLDEETIRQNHLVLFGDPGSNEILKQIVDRLPVKWSPEAIQIGGQQWSAADHGLVMIYPNPLNPAKYVVLNSGHTFHEKDFRSSNAWLFPRLGDVAVLKVTSGSETIEEQTVWADLFDSGWKLTSD